jgi:hypothetical protein
MERRERSVPAAVPSVVGALIPPPAQRAELRRLPRTRFARLFRPPCRTRPAPPGHAAGTPLYSQSSAGVAAPVASSSAASNAPKLSADASRGRPRRHRGGRGDVLGASPKINLGARRPGVRALKPKTRFGGIEKTRSKLGETALICRRKRRGALFPVIANRPFPDGGGQVADRLKDRVQAHNIHR